MKIFVVGGAGYIGSVCSELLLNEGHEVAIFDNLSEGHRGAVDSRTRFIEGELADRHQIQAALSTHRPDAHLIPAVLQVALAEKPNVDIYGTDYDTPDGTCIRDYIHILDLANAHILALGEAASGCYNLGTGGGSSVREVIESCRKITGRKIETIEKPRRPGDPPRLIASSERIKKELGWKPQFQLLDAIVESAWKWHQKFPRGYEN